MDVPKENNWVFISEKGISVSNFTLRIKPDYRIVFCDFKLLLVLIVIGVCY